MTGRVLAGAIALACTSPVAARADKCGAPATLERARDRATVVFQGVVDRVERDEPGCQTFLDGVRRKVFRDTEALTRACGLRATLRVAGVWKGDVAADTTVIQSVERACGLRFEAGRSYLVFASQVPGATGLVVFDASGTRPLEGADGEAALATLGPPR